MRRHRAARHAADPAGAAGRTVRRRVAVGAARDRVPRLGPRVPGAVRPRVLRVRGITAAGTGRMSAIAAGGTRTGPGVAPARVARWAAWSLWALAALAAFAAWGALAGARASA